MLELDPLRRDAQAVGQLALEPDRDVAQADRAVAGVDQGLGDQPGRVREVEQPRPVGAAGGHVAGDVEHDGDGAKRLREAARAGRLLADAAELRRHRLVQEPGGEPADPQLHEHERRSVDRAAAVGGADELAAEALPAQDPPGQPTDDVQAALVDVVQHELGEAQALGPQPQPLDQLGGVRAAPADDCDLGVFNHGERL